LNADLAAEIIKGIHRLEKETRLSFATSRPKGSVTDVMPLLLSVRSGAAVSMPGMMDTVLNLGINDELAKVMVKLSNNPRWVYDTYRRFLQMFGDVVLGIDMDLYERILMKYHESRRIETDSQLTELDLKEIVEEFKQFTPVPHDPYEQLRMAIVAVFNSWNSPNAMKYRDINNISSDLGTAIVIQSMVYGNMNDQSGSGVAFTRNPQTGDKEVYGDFLPNSEGEDVVAGIRNPMKLIELKDFMPKVFNALLDLESTLESHYRDVQVSVLPFGFVNQAIRIGCRIPCPK
jgi:pyruvate,orthophosphate dikinase